MTHLTLLSLAALLLLDSPHGRHQVLERLWDINPSTVFGVLCGCLSIGIIFLWRKVDQKDAELRAADRENVQLLRETLGTINKLDSLFTSLATTSSEVRTHAFQSAKEISASIHDSRDRIITQITSLSERIRS